VFGDAIDSSERLKADVILRPRPTDTDIINSFVVFSILDSQLYNVNAYDFARRFAPRITYAYNDDDCLWNSDCQ